MKQRIVIALMCMILATGVALAQKTFSFGPKVGLDYTHFGGKNASHGGQLNYQAGLFMEYRFTDKFSVAPEIVFAAQGGKTDGLVFIPIGADWTNYTTYADADNIYYMNYINIPVMLKYYVTPKLSIDFGPQIGFNVYHKCTTKSPGIDYKKTIDLKDAKKVDFALGLGVTYNITENVFIQARYTMGLTDVFKFNKENAFPIHTKNGNAQISIGFRF